MSVEIVRVSYDDVMRIADEFSRALLDVWQEQTIKEKLIAKYVGVDVFALDQSEQEAHRKALAELAAESERYWGIILQKGEALYQMAAQYGAGTEFLERFAVGLNLSELNTASFKLLEASAKSIRTGAFQRKSNTATPLRRRTTPRSRGPLRLTPNEKRVGEMLAAGHIQKQIAREMKITEGRVSQLLSQYNNKTNMAIQGVRERQSVQAHKMPEGRNGEALL